MPLVQGTLISAPFDTYSRAWTCVQPRTRLDSAHLHPLELQPIQDPDPLRQPTALKWPCVPDTSAYPDPLTRDDPKPLQLYQYEAIGTCPLARARLLLTLGYVATSPTIRTLLASPRFPMLLTSVDALRGPEREEALQRALGVHSRLLKNHDAGTRTAVALDEDMRALAEAVEEGVRGAREDVLGLDWDGE